jgi:hypothetical protein
MPLKLINAQGLSDVAHGLTIAALIIFLLYLAGVIVQPLAIAALLSFILAPVMRHLRIWGLPKVVSALLSVALTLTAMTRKGTTRGPSKPCGKRTIAAAVRTAQAHAPGSD